MKVVLVKKEHDVGNVWSYYFEPEESLRWDAGQALRYELPHQEGEERHSFEHWFTISNAPHDALLRITTRLSGSQFKNRLDSLKIGDEIIADGLEGDFTWKDGTKDKVFIAGGIGITPFLSMFAERAHKGLACPGHLIYANRDQDIPFKDELESTKGLHISYLTGPLTKRAIYEAEPDLHNKYVYLSGPGPMVEAVGQELLDSGQPKDQLKRDWFPGYEIKDF